MSGLLEQMRRAQLAQQQGLLSHTPSNRPTPDQVARGMADSLQGMGLLTAPIPVLGDAVGLLGDAAMYAAKPEERTVGNLGLSALGVLPFFPALAGKLGKAGKLLDVTDAETFKAVKAAMGGDKIPEGQIRHAVAQYNAALPKDAGGLGLGADNAAADRARGLDFTGNWFHGSPNANITEFDPTRAGARGVNFGHATFATNKADNASGYSLNWDAYKKLPQQSDIDARRQNIVFRFLRAREAGDVEKAASIRAELKSLKDGSQMYEDFLNYKIAVDGPSVYPIVMRADGMPWVDGGMKQFNQVHPQAISEARAQGAPGVRINDVADNSGRFNGTGSVMAVFDPARIRSRFAAFDPAQRDSRNLLASMAGVGLLSPAFLAADRDEQR